MRITIVNDGYRNCGGGLQLIKYANQMAALGHEVVLAYQFSDTFDLIPVPLPRIFAPAMSADQLPDADIILHSSWFMAARLMDLPLSKGAPVSFIMGFEQWSGRNEAIIDCWRLPVYKITPSAYLREQVWLQTGLSWPVIPFGIDFEALHPEGERTPPTPDDMVVGALYNNGPTKRMPDLVDTLARLHRERPGIGFELFGFEPRPDLDFPFEYHCRPGTDELRRMMSRCHVWLSMSDQEGLHVPPMEAMACGAVPVSSDIGGTRDYCLHRHNGLRFPVGDTAGAARAVLSLLDDPERWRTCADRSRRIIREMGSEAENVRRVLDFFERILEERDRGFPGLFAFETPYETNLSTLETYLREAGRMAARGEADRSAALARGVVRTLEAQAARRTGERFLSANGPLYGGALAAADPDGPTDTAARYRFNDAAVLARHSESRGCAPVPVHADARRFDGFLRACPTLAGRPGVPDGEGPGLGWEEWAAIFNRERRHLVLTGGDPLRFPDLARLINAVRDPCMVRVETGFGRDAAGLVAAIRRPCVFCATWRPGADPETFLDNVRAVGENPLAALELRCEADGPAGAGPQAGEALERDRALFRERGLILPPAGLPEPFPGADPANAAEVWCARRLFLLSPEGVRYPCLSKLIRRADAMEDARTTPLGPDRILARCNDWGRCAPEDGRCECAMHALRRPE